MARSAQQEEQRVSHGANNSSVASAKRPLSACGIYRVLPL